MDCSMVRIIGIFGMGGGFLILSPQLRHDVMGGLARQNEILVQYSPLSYITLGVIALGSALVYVYRCSKPR